MDTKLATLLKRPDPLLEYMWICDSLPFGLPVEYVETLDLPFNNIKIAEPFAGGAGYTYYPGTHDISSFSMAFYMDVQGTSLKWLNKWKGLVKDFKTNLYGLPSSYKQPITVILYDNRGKAVVKVKLTGTWPADTQNLSLSNSSYNRLILTQTFSCDGQEIIF